MERINITFYEIPDCDSTGILLTTSTGFFFSNMDFDQEDIDNWNFEFEDNPAWANQSYERSLPNGDINLLIDLFNLEEVQWPRQINDLKVWEENS